MNTDLFAPLKDFEFLNRSFCTLIRSTPTSWLTSTPASDDSRVVLHQTSDGADYINGNYISRFGLKRKFIVTEQPMPSTLGNFWSMIWEENTRVIVMLNGSEEEEQQSYPYLTPSQIDIISGDFKIKQKERNEEKDYTETVLIITHLHTGQSKRVIHLKYLKWSEHTFPDKEDILQFLAMMNERNEDFFKETYEYNLRMPGAIVVHGHAGVRRTATVIKHDDDFGSVLPYHPPKIVSCGFRIGSPCYDVSLRILKAVDVACVSRDIILASRSR
ncbi:hypothetical protein KQX54_004798 [Cotesia glomerata]|uniref:Tyrosine-protein phosphatase domain-containing protein n=1 Tax=Cotesia glomerata TaxID=32391 RepID=A0AAV7IBP3_COTGL|nr:hypothetical protein KQX54_004798 [Cotesia glomerata]